MKNTTHIIQHTAEIASIARPRASRASVARIASVGARVAIIDRVLARAMRLVKPILINA